MQNTFFNKRVIRQITFYSALFVIWQIVVWAKVWPEYMFPSPAKVLLSLLDGFKDRSFFIAIAISMKRIFIGYGISIVCGSLIGTLMRKYQFVDETMGSLILGLQTLPSVCWLPMAILWFGLNDTAIIFVVIIGAIFSITIATESGLKNIPTLYIRAGKNMGAKGLGMLWYVMLPAALPSIVTGLKQGWSFAWRSLMAGELLFVSLGLGHLLMMGRELNDMNRVVAVMFVIAFISILIDKLIFGRIEQGIKTKWGLTNK